MGRGGPRQGKDGAAYQNRTDLNNRKIPVQAATGQQYGAATAQKNAQSIIPMASGPLGIGSNPAQPQQANVPPPLTGSAPGTMPDLFGPTNNPSQHFMTGVNAGPGQGSEALAPNPFINNSANTILAVLNTIPSPSPQVNSSKIYLAMQQENQMPH